MLGGFKAFAGAQAEPAEESQTVLLLGKGTKAAYTGSDMGDPVGSAGAAATTPSAAAAAAAAAGREAGAQAAGPSAACAARNARRDGGGRVPGYIMLPDGQARSVWMQLQLAVAMYIIWVTPIRVGFNLPAEGTWFWVEGVIDVFFYIDLFLNFFVAFEDPVTGEVIADQKRIAARYLKGWFTIDLLATFPVDYIVRAVEGTWLCSLRGNCLWAATANGGVSAIRLLRVVRVFRIIWILKHFKVMRATTLLGGLADDLYTIMPAISILELLVVLLYLGHFSGCFFYLLSTPPYQTAVEKRLIEGGEMETWVTKTFGGDRMILMPTRLQANTTASPAALAHSGQDPTTKLWYECPAFGYDFKLCSVCDGPKARCVSHYSLPFRYVTSMYWAYTTMTTVGYGDISSVTVAEKVWAIVTMIGSGFFFSFVVGRMASVVVKLDSVRNAQSERLETVTTFLKDVDLPRALSKRVLDFFKKQQVKPYDRQQVLAMLPFELRSKILRQLYAGIIARVPLLRTMAHDDVFLTDVCVRLQHYTCTRDSFIYQRGEVGGDVFILVRGEVHVLDADGETLLLKIPEGSVFGEETVLRHMEGFPRAKRADNVWCATPCTLLRIAQEDMTDMLERYPELLHTLKKLNKARSHSRQQALKGTAIPPPTGQRPEAPIGLTGTQRLLARLSSGKRPGRQWRLAAAAEELPLLLDVDDAFSPRIAAEGARGEEFGNATAAAARAAAETQPQHQPQQQPQPGSEAVRRSLGLRVKSEPNLQHRASNASRGAADSGASRADRLPPAPTLAALDRSPSRGATNANAAASPLSTGAAAGASVALPVPPAPCQQEPAEALDAGGLQSLREHFADQIEALAEELNLQRHLIHEVPHRIVSELAGVLGFERRSGAGLDG
ncbi:voltage-gated ion channel [Raphidocelis subcapitata]|uniref:Voltage-gated ion channel n=1 Tax=Raphidocelis subcapitata TaxID=307507 RepID=A0A2V0PJR4_9CHLO|nr:voltage-gated ion channel [Raphidocelis subcapitata]|eukprot:GBG00035.1 voltage-gated ion channel [Raphidocelis subcapitata]